MALPIPPPLLLALGIVALVLYRVRHVGQRPKGLPPGPPTLPLIGNIHQMPATKAHLQFQRWAQEYGPVYSLILGTQVTVVLSSDQAVKDLLDKRSGIYSSRPDVYLGNIISGGFRLLLMKYGDTWRMLHKVIHNSLNINASRTYVPYQDLENKAMLLGLLETPAQFAEHIRRYTNSLTTQMIFGFRTTSIDDPQLKRLYHCVEKFSQTFLSPIAAALDGFPLLRKLPDFLLPARARARAQHRDEYDLFVGHYLSAKRRLRAGTAQPCFCVDLVRAQDALGFSDGIAGYTSGSLLEAGSDTTAATLVGFVQAMLCFPAVAAAAQAELDGVCGDRMPELDDAPRLPYIRGIVKESLRWMPTAALGVPHAVTRDDEYMGYTIPKGASIVLNVWGIANDPLRHPSPRVFDPTRWASDPHSSAASALHADATQRDHFVFGGGRRLCQGMHIADRSLFLACARLLWAFDVRRPRDPDSKKEVVPDPDDLTDGLLVVPRPYAADIVPRDEGKARKVREAWAEVATLLDGEEQWKTVPEGLVWQGYEPVEEPAEA